MRRRLTIKETGRGSRKALLCPASRDLLERKLGGEGMYIYYREEIWRRTGRGGISSGGEAKEPTKICNKYLYEYSLNLQHKYRQKKVVALCGRKRKEGKRPRGRMSRVGLS
jgi:hypothetical protein